MEDVTFIILTRNEEHNLPDCIRSIRKFGKRIIVVDSYSTDVTAEVAKSLGAEVHEHKFDCYASQFNWALDNIEIDTKWVFRLDADERLTPRLCKELGRLMREHSDDDVNGFTMEAWFYFLGKKIKHGGHNKRKLMLFKNGIGRIEDRKMDEHTILLEGKSISCRERFIHENFKDLNHWIDKMNWYATREMQDYIDYTCGKVTDIDSFQNDKIISRTRSKKYGFYYKLPMFHRTWLLFLYNYVIKLGFLDGREGFIYNYMYHRWYRLLVDAKIFEQEKLKGSGFNEKAYSMVHKGWGRIFH